MQLASLLADSYNGGILGSTQTTLQNVAGNKATFSDPHSAVAYELFLKPKGYTLIDGQWYIETSYSEAELALILSELKIPSSLEELKLKLKPKIKAEALEEALRDLLSSKKIAAELNIADKADIIYSSAEN